MKFDVQFLLTRLLFCVLRIRFAISLTVLICRGNTRKSKSRICHIITDSSKGVIF